MHSVSLHEVTWNDTIRFLLVARVLRICELWYLATHEVVADLQDKKEDFERLFLMDARRLPLLDGGACLAKHCMYVSHLPHNQQHLQTYADIVSDSMSLGFKPEHCLKPN